jgi:predicted transcriptional regulator
MSRMSQMMKGLTVEVAVDLTKPLEDMAGATRQQAETIVNRALEEYLDRRWRPPAGKDVGVGTSCYIEMTTREEGFDVI